MLALLAAGALPAMAVAAPAKTAPTTAAKAGVKYNPRDLSGVFVIDNYKSSSLPTRERMTKTIEGKPPPMLDWVKETYEKRIAAELDGKPLANNKTQCLPSGVPLMMITANYPIEFIQKPDQLTLVFEEDMAYRLIYMNDKHPDDPEPSYKGDSVGRWEGDTLVVDTVGFKRDTTLDQIGMPHTDKLHVIEHFKRISKDTIENVITVDDPGAFSAPWSMRVSYSRQPFKRLMEYVCNENNRNPIVNGVQTLK